MLLTNLAGEENRAAHFSCAAAFVVGDTEQVLLREWPGTVLSEAAGAAGFGYDPIFMPEGLSVSAAELSADEKNTISHRTQAFTAILPVVRETLLP